jgi:hypothetical protein
MRPKTWGIIGAVVVLAAAGTATALFLSGGGTTDYKSLPTCDKLAAAIPGKPALHVEQNVTDAADIRGLHPAFTNIRCESADSSTYVEVDLYQQSNMNPVTMALYPDKQVHDGAWRARAIFARTSLTPLNADTSYGSLDYAGGDCTVTQVKHNADVMYTVPLKDGPSDQRKAQCEQIARTQMPKVIDAAL